MSRERSGKSREWLAYAVQPLGLLIITYHFPLSRCLVDDRVCPGERVAVIAWIFPATIPGRCRSGLADVDRLQLERPWLVRIIPFSSLNFVGARIVGGENLLVLRIVVDPGFGPEVFSVTLAREFSNVYFNMRSRLLTPVRRVALCMSDMI